MNGSSRKSMPAPFLDAFKRYWLSGLVLGPSYFVLMLLSEQFIPHPATLFPAAAIALAGLFLTSLRLWPVVYVAALAGSALAGFPLLFLILSPIAQTLQAVVGAYLLRKTNIDPLFRR